VFYSKQNYPLQASTLGYTLHKSLDEVKIDTPGPRFHILRHSHVALLLNSRVVIYTVSRCLGHTRFDITLNTYEYFD
jgi:integrase